MIQAGLPADRPELERAFKMYVTAPKPHQRKNQTVTAKRSQNGFTLIELMIVIVIVAILAAVAIPGYQEYVRKSHRAAAAQFVADIANLQAQYLLDNRTYAGNLAALGITSEPANVDDFFNVSITVDTTVAPYEFTVTAAGIGMHSGESITMNHLNQRTGPDGSWGDD